MHRSSHSLERLVDTRRIVVVGPCASGKTTLTHHLRELGFDAKVCGQEHSAIQNLWKQLQPDVLIALNIDLGTLRKRRHSSWPERLYWVQHQRLRSAFGAADLSIDSSATSTERVVETVLTWIEAHPFQPSGPQWPDGTGDRHRKINYS